MEAERSGTIRRWSAWRWKSVLGLAGLYFLVGIIGIAVTLAGLWLLIFQPFRQYPPGFADIGRERDWNPDNVGHFIELQIPAQARDFVAEGQLGLVGSYGIFPTLEFSFTSTPDVANAFAAHFCNGVLHPGFDPFNSIESDSPGTEAVLVRGKGTIHYAYSNDTSLSVRGNRCSRWDGRINANWYWLEEIVLDTTNPNVYRVSYHLPFDPNSSGMAEEVYPRAYAITPLGDAFRLNVTGFRALNGSYVLGYPTICMETRALARVWDRFAFDPSLHSGYENAEVSIAIDGIAQPSAVITEDTFSLRPTDSTGTDAWQYCITKDWQPGRHSMEIVIVPINGNVRVFDWEFVVPNAF